MLITKLNFNIQVTGNLKKNGDSAYIPTEKLGNLCRRIESVILPSINKLVEEYDEQERQLLGN